VTFNINDATPDAARAHPADLQREEQVRDRTEKPFAGIKRALTFVNGILTDLGITLFVRVDTRSIGISPICSSS